MKTSQFKKLIREEVASALSLNEATFTLPKEFVIYRASGMTPQEGGYGEFNYGVAYFHSSRERLNMTDVAKNANAAFKMAKQVAQAIKGDRAEGMASLGGDDVKNVKIHAMKTDDGESGIGFTAYVYSKMSPKDVKKAVKGPGVKGLTEGWQAAVDGRDVTAERRKTVNEATITIDPTLLGKLKTAVTARKRDPEDENAHDELENILMQIYQKMGAEDAEGLAAYNMEDEVTMTGPVSAVVSLIKDTAEEEGL
jgi:hypothetical protein